MKRRIIIFSAFSLLLFAGIMLSLWLKCPQYLMYHEQYQLFLFTWDYFVNSVSIPGGLADYLSEFIVQFYYVPVYGAALAALTLSLSQVFLGLSFRRSQFSDAAYFLSAIPSILFLGAMSDENILFSYAMAMLLTSLAIYLFSLSKKSSPSGKPSILRDTLSLILGFILFYWAAGPFAFVFIVAGGIMRRNPIVMAIVLTSAILIVYGIHAIWFSQYPLNRMLFGINYFRVPEIYPSILYIIAAVTAILPLIFFLNSTFRGTRGLLPSLVSAAVVLFAIVYVPSSFDERKSSILEYDSLVRQSRWNDIILKAKEERPTDIFSLQAVNLALGMTGQLTESMFQFEQKGIEGLIGKDRLDNTTQLITTEAIFRLGLTNIAFSTTFDLQEAIMNDRKSGRMMKRMAECMLVNGNYKVAAKYIGFLRNSLFYADWANRAESLLYNDRAVEAHPVYGPMRRNAFKKVAFYDHTQLDKILAMHAVDSEGSNPLAWQYFCAATMLKGDLPTLTGVYNYSANQFDMNHIPRHVQEAIAMYWTFSHDSFDGVPFPLSHEVKQQTAALAQAVMKNRNNPSAWQAAAPGSFGVYFLQNQRNQQVSSSGYQHSHE